ncbi:acyltransferase domain-containing protein [Streptomyces sp. LP11]|uniref:[acyl-carrier-protein] S-malonyltransferase n=1 Tax=Streptomyces pyxinicus TaxID=2970331 RepID=A0ABT2B2Q0_9ACTN|nr:acyltransferase domain-containing protein [Streptomyces sp. LP11]MCS0602771.1 acyltransferase domain-containing protein [Streptomyces sp. LP11]
MSVAWAFPGQGSQRKDMGAGLFDRHPGTLARADAVLGRSVRELSADQTALRDTRVLQPVLYTIGALTYLDRAAREPQPDWMIGHSLGEYTALYASGALDFETGLRLVVARAEIMGRARGGGMLAVVGLGVERLREVMRREGADDIDVANHNSPVQTVLSGPEESVRALAPVLRREGAGKCVLLHISVAAHSRYMTGAADELGAVLDTVTFREPRVPVVSNVTARPHRADHIALRLREHMCQGVRWWDSLAHLVGQGVTELVELGPGSVLTKLWATARAELPPPQETPGAVVRSGTGAAAGGEVVPATRNGRDTVPDPERGGGGVAVPGTREDTGGTRRRPVQVARERLGSARFQERYGTELAWVVSGTGDGAVGDEVCRAARTAGLAAFTDPVADGPDQASLGEAARSGWGIGLRPGPDADAQVTALLAHGVRHVEAGHPHGPDAALVRFRFTGAHRGPAGTPVAARHVLARVTGLDQAAAFLRPPAPALLAELVRTGGLSAGEADAARELPVASDLAVQAPGGWHDDGADAYQLLPSVALLAARSPGPEPVHVGLCGVAGTPEQAATAFALGAAFLVSTSLTACAPAARLADPLKDTLARAGDDDVTWAPTERHGTLGVPARVLRRGTLFPARAGLLHRLLREQRYFADVPEHRRRHIEEHLLGGPATEPPADGRLRTADVFRRYARETARRTPAGEPVRPLDHQLPCDPELTHFNRATVGTALAAWTARTPEAVAGHLLTNAAELLTERTLRRAETRP